MSRVEKMVFLSYRRSNASWALLVYQALKVNGFDVFFDFEGIGSGDFESIILQQIRARAHFIVLLTPSALERCGTPGDWLRREIEAALDERRNIVPLMLDGFDFAMPSVSKHLTGKLAQLKRYNAVDVPANYFNAAMDRLCSQFLDVALDVVLHPPSPQAQQAAVRQREAADREPDLLEGLVVSWDFLHKASAATNIDERIRLFTQAIETQPLDDARAGGYLGRAVARIDRGDYREAIADASEVIRRLPSFGLERGHQLPDWDSGGSTSQVQKELFKAYYHRSVARHRLADSRGALADADDYVRGEPDDAEAYVWRSTVREAANDLRGAVADADKAIRLKPDHPIAYFDRGMVRVRISQPTRARKRAEVEAAVRDLKACLRFSRYGPADRKMVQDIIDKWQQILRSTA